VLAIPPPEAAGVPPRSPLLPTEGGKGSPSCDGTGTGMLLLEGCRCLEKCGDIESK